MDHCSEIDQVQDVLSNLVGYVEMRHQQTQERSRIAESLELEGLSKSGRKKAVKRKLRQLQHQERRKEERARVQKRSREKNAEIWQKRRQLIESGELTEEQVIADAVLQDSGRVAKVIRLQRDQKMEEAFHSNSTQRIIIDCEFDDVMTEKEVIAFRHQLRIAYGSNKRAEKPARLYYAGMSASTSKALGEESLSWLVHQSERSYLDQFEPSELVYLTADAEEMVDDLDPLKAYIIGGIVDHNRLKRICYDKARAQNICMRSLPIQAYLEGGSRRVLTVNQVSDILIQYSSCRDWKVAFERIIPPRKGFKTKQSDTIKT
uniref:tRNA (guanine(9)-N(1))-methyltransferase n=1 Tax=Spongospora subterranea TaxID=70186 RepID=A0A0H5RCJ8_9EUKA|eukprot:CRZ11302.1 hypothetical protein [Spongospora subterranea]